MRRHAPCQLRMAGFSEPGGASVAVPKHPVGVIDREGLVDVMEERGSLDEPSIDVETGLAGAMGKERGELGDHGHVLQQTR